MDEIYIRLKQHELLYIDKAEQEVLKNNIDKAQIYQAKADAVRECIKLLRKK